jgi:hypothetical protein
MIFVLKGFSQSGKKGYDAEKVYPLARPMRKNRGGWLKSLKE